MSSRPMTESRDAVKCENGILSRVSDCLLSRMAAVAQIGYFGKPFSVERHMMRTVWVRRVSLADVVNYERVELL